MRWGGIVPLSLIDFPTHICAVLFTCGCSYNCFYCHNRQLLKTQRALLSHQEIQDFLLSRKGLLDGVVISGGEPTLHEDLLPVLQEIHVMGFAIKLDTNGSNPQRIQQLVDKNLLDYVSIDIKSSPSRYHEICRGNSDVLTVLHTIDILKESSVVWEARTTIAPTITIEELVEIAQLLPARVVWKLQHYRKPPLYLPEDEEIINKKPLLLTQNDVLKLKRYHPHLQIVGSDFLESMLH